jgi:two-component system chemotaxis sensor kinase CheA
MTDNEEFIQEFLEESDESLDQLDRDFVALESDPRDRDRLASVFRAIHTIKGTCGFFGFSKLGAIAHASENLLGRLRDGQLLLDEEITSALLESVDAIREILTNIEKSGHEGNRDNRALSDKLARLLDKEQAPIAADQVTADPVESDNGTRSGTAADALAAADAKAEPTGVAESVPSAKPTSSGAVDTSDTSEESLVAASSSPPPEQTPASADPEKQPDQKADAVVPGLTEGSIRVDVGLLNNLMNLVGELVLARNQLLQFTQTEDDRPFLNLTQRLSSIATELQEGVMKTRMQPIDNVWGKFPRVVRDLALACGKEVRLEMEGKETELDRSLVESIKDPLTHLIRNAIDHGIESPAVRAQRGKPAAGQLLLRAFHEGGQVNIEITDDGSGIDPERVKRKALEQNLVTREELDSMSERGIVNLIFNPGFSTAETVTDVSGRGVGMDVVKTNIERIGGTIDLRNRPGQGTTVRVRIPLTLAIIPALIVSAGGDRIAIPQVSLIELLSFDGDEARRAIEMIHDKPVYRLRGELLPLVYLNRELQIEDASSAGDGDVLNVVVLNAQDCTFGLVVDAINNAEEIVVKPLNAALSALELFSGATIMGDGAVALILDVGGLARRAGMSLQQQRQLGESAGTVAQHQRAGDRLLLCESGPGRRIAIPLAQVTRLEEFSQRLIEQAADREVVQYRGEILPLVRLPTAFGQSSDRNDSIQVVVSEHNGQMVGVVVDKILDVVSGPMEAEATPDEGQRTPVADSIVIDQRVTDVVDLANLVRTVNAIAG